MPRTLAHRECRWPHSAGEQPRPIHPIPSTPSTPPWTSGWSRWTTSRSQTTTPSPLIPSTPPFSHLRGELHHCGGHNHGIKQLSNRAGHALADYAVSCGYVLMRFRYLHVCFYFPNPNDFCAVSCKYALIYKHIFFQSA